jgi:hypothetical protein
MPVSTLKSLGQLTSELEGTSVEAVMLPLALPDQRIWPAEMMVERFVEIIKAMASENSTASTLPH